MPGVPQRPRHNIGQPSDAHMSPDAVIRPLADRRATQIFNTGPMRMVPQPIVEESEQDALEEKTE